MFCCCHSDASGLYTLPEPHLPSASTTSEWAETAPALVRITGLGLNLGSHPSTTTSQPWPSPNGHPHPPRSSPARAHPPPLSQLRSSPAALSCCAATHKATHPCRAPPGLVPAILQLTPPATWPVACLNLSQSRAKKFPIVPSRGSVAPHSPSLLGLCGTTCVYFDLDLHLPIHLTHRPDYPLGLHPPFPLHLDTFRPTIIPLLTRPHLPECISSHNIFKALWAVASIVAHYIPYLDPHQRRQPRLGCQYFEAGAKPSKSAKTYDVVIRTQSRTSLCRSSPIVSSVPRRSPSQPRLPSADPTLHGELIE